MKIGKIAAEALVLSLCEMNRYFDILDSDLSL
jgi:hypothetical protein